MLLFLLYFRISTNGRIKKNGIKLPKLLNGTLGTIHIGLFEGCNEFSGTKRKLGKVTSSVAENKKQEKPHKHLLYNTRRALVSI